MARKREELDADLPEGKLTHNPFAALRPGGAAPSAKPAAGAKPAGKKVGETKLPPGKLPPAKLPPVKLVVRHESKGHGGKTVTCVAGFEAGTDVTQLARELSKALGAGARDVDGELVLQGKQVERVATWLEARGYARVVRGN